MSEAKYTRGEWVVENKGFNPLVVAQTADGPVAVAEVLDDCFPDAGQQNANAALISAAPDLLSALQMMASMWHRYIMPENYNGHAAKAYSDAVGAIRKATGDQS